MDKTVDFCSYRFPSNKVIVVNVTNQPIRMKKPDGEGIVEIPSSVLPKGEIPEAYKTRAKELDTTVEKVCDSSLFIDVERNFVQTRQEFVYREKFEAKNESDPFNTRIYSRVRDYVGRGIAIFLIGTHNAARAYVHDVLEGVPVRDGEEVIRCDRFIAYNIQDSKYW